MTEILPKPILNADETQPGSVAQSELPFEGEIDTPASGLAAIGSESVRIATWSLGDSPPDGYDTRENNAWLELGGNIPRDQLERKRLKNAGRARTTKKLVFESFSGAEVEVLVNGMMREFIRINKTQPTDDEIINMSKQAERELRNPKVG